MVTAGVRVARGTPPRRHPTIHVYSVDGNFVSIGLSIASYIVCSWHLHHPQRLPPSLPITYHYTFLSSGKPHHILAAKSCYFLTVAVTQSGLSLDLGSGSLHKFAPHPTLLATHGAVGCRTRLLKMVVHLGRQLSFLLTASMPHPSGGSGRGGGSWRGQGGGRLKVWSLQGSV